MKKKYIDAELRVVTLTTNVIATSNYGVNDGQDGNGEANDAGNAFAPSRYGRRDYDLY